ncbi:MAG: SpoVA/SpoVAEb family sporulation membrane protein [Clostridiales bacterium]|jgi:stage V sporulation protein AC|nr:SpoVA/SpoVAEb family sporulation membrane protein [Clostridiales bacterium]
MRVGDFAYGENSYQLDSKRYNEYVKSVTPQTSTVKSLSHSFAIGGFTCVLAQAFYELFAVILPNQEPDMIGTYALMSIVFLAILFTGLGFYDAIGRWGGAGAFLPITGFANSMAASSMEFYTEGLVFGTSVKMFSLVGPVIVHGVLWSTVAGIIHYIIMLFI